jgi:O-methyltransferase
MYRHLNQTSFDSGRQPLDFFEFGVHLGGSLRLWCELHSNPETRFFGFDSFEGLPEEWTPGAPAGAYSAHGNVPEINDSRVHLLVGWFQDTMQDFLKSYRPKNRLVIHNDSDLYSSTLYCLTKLDALIVPGTLVIFDEFHDPIHEYRALCDYTSAYRRKYKIIAMSSKFTQAAVEFI